jgi:predicted amidohydrolase
MPRVAAIQLPARSLPEADLALEEALSAVAEAASVGAQLAVLPECTWPAYLLGTDHPDRWPATTADAVVRRFADAAREHGMVLVVGLALPVANEPSHHVNAAVVIESDGQVVLTARKRFLWDVDALWFDAGTSSDVVATSVGRLGVMICADGRMPEIARELALAGAEILIDPTAWVTAGPDPLTWNNAQAIHMFPSRARENGIWAVAANKVGIERDLVAYCGRSVIVAPDGSIAARAPSDAAAVITVDVTLAPAAFPVPRRPELYGILTAPTEGLPVVRSGALALVPSASSRRLAVSSLTRALDRSDLHLLGDAGVDLLAVVDTAAQHDGRGSTVTTAETSTTAASHLRSGHVVRRTSRDEAVLLDPAGTIVATWQRTHGAVARGTTIGPVVDTPAGAVGVLMGEDGVATEPARVLMLGGADIVVWFSGDVAVGTLAATRAAENRVLLLVVPEPGRGEPARILSPDGVVVADTGAVERLASAVVALDDARRKEMAPGTDVVNGRQPSCYGALVAVPPDGVGR